ncbi:MAG: GTPase HflX [Candidatus Dadabacteria bacterium]|nr:MAG: GTPase HflX [Candidatus Dadabacteria bacterium]
MSFVESFFGRRDDVRTLVVAPYAREGELRDRFDEFVSLCQAAELDTVGVDAAPVREIHPGTYFRSGQIERFREAAEIGAADLVAVDADLSPVQQRQLERELGRGVLDRSAIILTIFGRRARTRTGKLQVALAQNEYVLPRLVGLWGHFDREKGGIGLRGAGEKQIEIDRRLIKRRIARLRQELSQVGRTQQLHRARRKRSPLMHAAIIGYTNVGKSTLLREFSNRSVFVRDMPFATLDTLTRRITLNDGTAFLVTDTVGFVRDLPHGLVEAFRSTLLEAAEADVLIHVIDASAPDPGRQVEVTRGVLSELGVTDRPTLYVLNKQDLARGSAPAIAPDLSPVVGASIVRGEGIDAIVDWLRHQARAHRRTVTVRIPLSRPELVALGEAEAASPGRWGHDWVEYDVPADSTLAAQTELRT